MCSLSALGLCENVFPLGKLFEREKNSLRCSATLLVLLVVNVGFLCFVFYLKAAETIIFLFKLESQTEIIVYFCFFPACL